MAFALLNSEANSVIYASRQVFFFQKEQLNLFNFVYAKYQNNKSYIFGLIQNIS